jgi:transposase-like protein
VALRYFFLSNELLRNRQLRARYSPKVSSVSAKTQLSVERRSFTREFKLESVRLVKERGVSVAQAARDVDVDGNMLRKWIRDLEADPQHSFPGQGQMKNRAAGDRAAAARSHQAQGRTGHPKTYGPPRPQRGDRGMAMPVCINVSGLRVKPWPRWISARPGPHKSLGVERRI